MSIIVEKAIKAKNAGYTYVASIVKRYKFTNYYHVVSLDRVIRHGKWIPASFVQFASGARGRVGVTGKNVDWEKTILRALW